MPQIDSINPSGPQPDAGGGGGGTDIVSAIVGAAAMAYSAYQARKAGQEANAANRSLAEYSYAQDQLQWDRSNEYNSPAAQMARLKEAGLNPNLIYGGGSGGAAGTASSSSPKFNAPTINAVPTGIPGQIPQMLMLHQDLQLKQAQIDNVKSHTDNVMQDTVNKSLSPGKIIAQTSNLEQDLYQKKGLAPYQLEAAKHGTVKAETEALQGWKKLGLMTQEEQMNALRVDAMKRNLKSIDLENEKRHADVIFKQKENELRAAGITSSDHPALRVLIRLLTTQGLMPSEMKP